MEIFINISEEYAGYNTATESCTPIDLFDHYILY